MARISFFTCLLFLSFSAFAQLRVSTFEELEALQSREKRPVIVFIHTSWCKYCKIMTRNFQHDKLLSERVDKEFYLVNLDAEEQKPITFAGKTFRYKPSGNNIGVHELATELGTINGSLAYPALCFLNSQNEIIYQHEGFVDAKGLIKILEVLSLRQ